MEIKKILFFICFVINSIAIYNIECAAALVSNTESDSKQKMDYFVVSFPKDMESYLGYFLLPTNYGSAALQFFNSTGSFFSWHPGSDTGSQVKFEKIDTKDDYISFKLKLESKHPINGLFRCLAHTYDIKPGHRYFFSGFINASCQDVELVNKENYKGVIPNLVKVESSVE